MDHAALLDALANDRPAGIAALRRAFRGRLVATIVRITGDRQVAEELSDDILTDFVIDHAPRLRAAAALPRYLRLMAVRRAVRHRDRGRRHGPLPPELPGIDPTPMLDRALDAAGHHARLADCIAEQPLRIRRILRMRFAREASLRAIGEALGLSKQFVGRTLKAALATLGKCMARRERQP